MGRAIQGYGQLTNWRNHGRELTEVIILVTSMHRTLIFPFVLLVFLLIFTLAFLIVFRDVFSILHNRFIRACVLTREAVSNFLAIVDWNLHIN
jgi:hypothetical protein